VKKLIKGKGKRQNEMIRRQMNEEIPFLVYPITFRFAGKIPAKP